MVGGFEDILKENAKAMLKLRANTLFSSQNWAMEVSQEANMATANGLFYTELDAKGINLVDDNGLKLQTKEGTPYFVDNKEVTPQDFANSLLAGHKLLKVTDTKTTVTTPTTTITGNGMDASVVAAAAKALELNASMQDLGKQV